MQFIAMLLHLKHVTFAVLNFEIDLKCVVRQDVGWKFDRIIGHAN